MTTIQKVCTCILLFYSGQNTSMALVFGIPSTLTTRTTSRAKRRRMALVLSNDDTDPSEQFPFCHVSIASTLAAGKDKEPPMFRENKRFELDPATFLIRSTRSSNSSSRKHRPNEEGGVAEQETAVPIHLSKQELIDLAQECNVAIASCWNSEQSPFAPHLFLHSVVRLAYQGNNGTSSVANEPGDPGDHHPNNDTNNNNDNNGSNIFLATLLATNALEGAIRRSVGVTTGRAPLLKDMLSKLDDDPAANHGGAIPCILQTLLLPTGLNLRNLLWHGFVGASLPPTWLALVVILTRQLLLLLLHPTSSSHSDKQKGNPCQEPFQSSPLFVNNTTTHHGNGSFLSDYPVMTPVLRRGEEFITSPSALLALSTRVQEWLLLLATPTRAATSNNSHPRAHPQQMPGGAQAQYHAQLWQLAATYIHKRSSPACVACLLSLLLEHGLRQDWCHVNHLDEHSMARPHEYYVTLDGHGQKHQHELLLHPYIRCIGEDDDDHGTGGAVPNALISKVGGSTIALLTDLFCSSSGATNIRAALSHGVWDTVLQQELMEDWNHGTCSNTPTQTVPDKDTSWWWDVVRALLVATEGAALSSYPPQQTPSSLLRYRPIFSYTATTIRSSNEAQFQLKQLSEQLKKSQLLLSVDCNTKDKHSALLLQFQNNRCAQTHSFKDLLSALPRNSNEGVTAETNANDGDGDDASYSSLWTAEDVFREHDCNVRLSTCTAARALLADVAIATIRITKVLQESSSSFMDTQQGGGGSGRSIRRFQRLTSMADVALSMYTFFTYVALLFLQDKVLPEDEDSNAMSATRKDASVTPIVNQLTSDVLLKAVERSRMCCSTMNTFLVPNSDRAIKAATNYAKSKAVQTILQHGQSIESAGSVGKYTK